MSKDFAAVIEWRSPQDLTPYVLNSKEHAVDQIDKVAGSISEFGFDQPIVVDEEGVILKGHARREASIRLGLDKVPVIVRGDLSNAQKKAARIADNKVAESPWLHTSLSLELQSLAEMDFDLSLTGFDEEELAGLLDSVEEDASQGDPDECPDPEEVEPRCKLGEIWRLGRHRILVGDSTDEGEVRRLLGDHLPDMVFADPPYGINIVATNGYVGGGEAYDIPFGGVKNRKGYVGGVTATVPLSQSAKREKPKKN